MEPELTDDVKTMLGSPRRALFSMALPITAANMLVCCNNLIDSVWLSGIGTAALAATGVVFPFFFLLMGMGNGIGVGAAQAIARHIGAKDYETTHRLAAQAVCITGLIGIVTSVILLVLCRPLLVVAGAGDYLAESMMYAFPLFLCAPIILLSLVFTSILRSEGAAKRMMYMSASGAVINMILDPIFIYGFKFGVSGAAWATSLSMAITLMFGIYWYFIKKDTFVRIPLKGFRFDKELDWDILRVGIPASFEIIMVGIVTLVMNQLANRVDPVSGVAVFGTGWRIVDLLIIPGMALGNAVVPIAAAAYGAKRLDKVKATFTCSVLYGFAIMVPIGVFTFLAAPLITSLFTYSSSAEIADGLIYFLRTGGIFMPFTALAYSSYGLFQSMGMGVRSMTAVTATNALRIPVCLVIMVFSATLTGLCQGTMIAEIVGSFLSFVWASLVLRRVISSSDAGPSVPDAQ